MLWLPTLRAHSHAVAVSDHSASALERVMLSNDAQSAADELAEDMLADGWLVVWAQQVHGGPCTSVLELSHWLASDIQCLLEQLSDEQPDAWQHLSDWDARGRAAGVLAASRHIDPTYCRHWRSTSPDYVRRLTDLLRRNPCAWPDDNDEEFRHYIQIDPGVAWRLPRLAAKLRLMGTTDEMFEQRVQQAMLEAMKELAYGASHEINNPLANISGRAQMLLKGETDPQRRRMLAAIDAQALRAHEMISDLMHFARPPRLEREQICLSALVEKVVAERKDELTARRIDIEIADDERCAALFADSDQLHMALLALVQNSMEAIGVDGHIAVNLCVKQTGDSQVAQITIADDGRGIAEDVRPKVFDPFFSGREAGRGLGFGLSKAWRIITEHGGTIDLVDLPGYSSTFSVHLPLAAATR